MGAVGYFYIKIGMVDNVQKVNNSSVYHRHKLLENFLFGWVGLICQFFKENFQLVSKIVLSSPMLNFIVSCTLNP
jgi:hypothetical protein